jgi:glycosyltransferase involved in cell wall biosynthesis
MRQFTGLSESLVHSFKHKAGLSYAMKRASVAVMVSENTRNETLAKFNEDRYAAKTDTVPWGVPAGFANASGVEPLRPDFIEGHHFITAMYDPFPHKRMDLLERVVPLLDEHGWDLVVLGGMRGGNIDLRIDHPKVHYPGFVDYDLMPRYIKGSALFLFTSEYEGFGFPPYEAMTLGVPVLYSSRCAALHDVIGDASHQFSGDEEMVGTLDRLMTEEDELIAHVGQANRLVERFDWRLAAKRYQYLFEIAYSHRDGPIDFTSSEPLPAQRAVPSTMR